jgi:hypothetical protein
MRCSERAQTIPQQTRPEQSLIADAQGSVVATRNCPYRLGRCGHSNDALVSVASMKLARSLAMLELWVCQARLWRTSELVQWAAAAWIARRHGVCRACYVQIRPELSLNADARRALSSQCEIVRAGRVSAASAIPGCGACARSREYRRFSRVAARAGRYSTVTVPRISGCSEQR